MDDETKELYKKIAAIEKKVQEQQKEIDELRKLTEFIINKKNTYSAPGVLEL